MSAPRTLLRLGVFMFLALPIVQCQAGNSTPPTAAKKTADAAAAKKVATEKAAAEKAAAEKPAAQKAADAAADAAKSTSVTRLENARVDAIDSDYKNVSLTDCIPGQPDPEKIVCNGKVFHLKVNDLALRAKVKPYHPGDHVRVDITGANELQDILGAWHVPAEGVCVAYRLLVLAACALVILGLATAATKGAPLKFIVGADNRYSNSKTQIAVWFWVVISSYLAVVVFRLLYAGWDFLGGVSIPQNLLVLSGLSAITYGGAKAITTSKVNAAMAPKTQGPVGTPTQGGNPASSNQPNQNPGNPGSNANANQANANAPSANAPNANPPSQVGANPPNPNAAPTGPANLSFAFSGQISPPAMQFSGAGSFSSPTNPKNPQQPGQERFFKDLMQNDYGDFDFGDFQMLVVTLIAVGMYMLLVFHFLESIEFVKTASLPDVDTTILAGFGLGQGAYLAKKAGGDPGKT
ncbi:MAG: hypothetical protein WB562_14600 [Candidatus Sulfotelmatobacter sp.]